ncbi:glucan 1,3-beta-glucosidase [Diplogelasinospora grovesii]|uniref:Glucan 1,3-beta-glucosidase n=1 Tax=Diplogelasinospora grovesii TaxID=303347 RepID=A0AAN6MYH7_9PEZI|nr:glucan 1,3-beta-glucosidase [Diplogelasinospora grovesii]
MRCFPGSLPKQALTGSGNPTCAAISGESSLGLRTRNSELDQDANVPVAPFVLGSRSFKPSARIFPEPQSPWLVALSSQFNNATSPRLANATNADIEAARQIVKDAIAQASRLNKARLDNPAKNHYKLAPGTIVGGRTINRRSSSNVNSTAPPLLDITPEIAEAAALVAEADALANGTVKRTIFRNVMDYGATGNGVTDDTVAIAKAMFDGNRCGAGCNGATTLNAIVYFPAGTYLVSTNITVLFGTQVISDPTDMPTIKASGSFVGLGVLSTDVYVGDGTGADGKDNEWYINTASFYRQIRNIKIDITATDPNAYVCAIHYQVAQATSLQNVELIATTGTTQQGMFSENGSGGFMSDVTFTGGNFGFYGGNQQFTVQRLTFNGCKTAVQIIWGWGWVWKSITVTNAEVGFLLDSNGSGGNIGSATFVDSVFTDVTQAIVIDPPSSTPGSGSTGIMLDNVAFNGVTQAIISWVLGPVYNGTSRTWASGSSEEIMPIVTLYGQPTGNLPQAPYFERAREQYTSNTADDFVHLKDLGAVGDGVTDDTAAVQAAFTKYAGSKIIFADAGVYLLTSTVVIPAGTKIAGETWTQFAATGSNFGDPSNPVVMLQVGNIGDVGSVEMQDLIFTTKGPTPDCHARLGGATGTELTPNECPAYTDGTVNDGCLTASLVMHLTYNSSGYFENMWLWTADHMIDDPNWNDDKNQMTQISVFTARGMLIESQTATWLYATASEHAVYYQFNFAQAQNIYAGLLQTESPYYQPTPSAPAPYAPDLGVMDSDPEYDCGRTQFDGCDSSWAVIMSGCQDIVVASMGVYSWFDDYTQDCIDEHTCQKALIYLNSNYNRVRLEQIITIGANYSIVADGTGISYADNLDVTGHPKWSQISLFDAPSQGDAPTDDESDDDILPPCDWTKSYPALTDLQNDLPNIPTYCATIYALPILRSMLGTAWKNYTNTENGYTDKFNAYVGYVKDMVPIQLGVFMDWETDGPGNKYFTCTYELGGNNISVATCPNPGIDWNDNPDFFVYYELNNATGFYDELLSTYGIEESWVTFGEVDTESNCYGVDGCLPDLKVQYGFPKPSDNITVPNPEDVFTQGLAGFQALQTTLASIHTQMVLGWWNGNNAVTEVAVMPVSMAYAAAQGMEQVVLIGGEVEAAQMKSLILEILGIVFLVIPFIGEGLLLSDLNVKRIII